MSHAQVSKPKRLVIAALLNILLAILAFGALYLLVGVPEVREKVQIGGVAMWTSITLASLLLLSSVAALLNFRNSHLFMLGAAVLFYGTIIVQNAALLPNADLLLNAGGETKLWSNMVRKVITLAFTAWATLSEPSRAYFASRRRAP